MLMSVSAEAGDTAVVVLSRFVGRGFREESGQLDETGEGGFGRLAAAATAVTTRGIIVTVAVRACFVPAYLHVLANWEESNHERKVRFLLAFRHKTSNGVYAGRRRRESGVLRVRVRECDYIRA